MYKAPNRTKHEITQSYNDGLLTIYETRDTAKPGYAPKVELVRKAALRYEEQRLGINRLYSAKQHQIEIERVVRCPRTDRVNTQDIAQTEDGRHYQVESVQSVPGVYPPSVDIALAKTEQVAS